MAGHLLTDEKANFVIRSVDELALSATGYRERYTVDQTTARFFPLNSDLEALAS